MHVLRLRSGCVTGGSGFKRHQSRDSFEQFRRNHQAGARKVGNDAKRQSAGYS